MDAPAPRSIPAANASCWRRWLIVLAGIVLGQFIIYGPSLIGGKVLLPVDLLAAPGTYLPRTPETQAIVPHDPFLSDLILQFETARQFAVSEIHAGRFPMWVPYQFAGTPFVWPKYSPFLLLGYLTPSPVIIAWAQMLAALVTGFGAYAFFRRAVGVSFWPAVLAAWCYPLTGFFVFWQGFPTCASAYWFPWLLLAIDETVRRKWRWAPIGLCAVTLLVLVSGHLDVAGQTLLGGGLYSLWCIWDVHHRDCLRAPGLRTVRSLVLAWLIGFMLAAPHLLPLLEHARTGARMERRSAGETERPPTGLSALPQTVLPDMYGATRAGSIYFVYGNQIESAAAIYAGVLASLLVAPLAFCSRRHRAQNCCWLFLIFFGLSWCLNIPGFVHLLRLPGLNMMSHNRLVFIASFAILALAAVGFEVLLREKITWRRWFFGPALVLAGLAIWCFYRASSLPEPIATQLETTVAEGKSLGGIRTPDGVRQAQAWFIRSYTFAGIWCGLGVAGWLLLRRHDQWPRWVIPGLGALMLADSLSFARDRSAQSDPALYYPRLPVLEQIAKSKPGRVVGFLCLPPALAQTHWLRDVRGYDSIDPGRYTTLLNLGARTNANVPAYSTTQGFLPRTNFEPPAGLKVPPVLNLLGLRYFIFRGTPDAEITPAFRGPDYWALVNEAALPRAFVPEHVEMIASDADRLAKLGSDNFDPLKVAYVETPVALTNLARGTVNITTEIPIRVSLAASMETPGMVVLTDLWTPGWRATINGKEAPVLRVNHALRGVVLPAGNSALEFYYAPESHRWGVWFMEIATILIIAWAGIVLWPQDPKKLAEPQPQML